MEGLRQEGGGGGRGGERGRGARYNIALCLSVVNFRDCYDAAPFWGRIIIMMLVLGLGELSWLAALL